MDFLILNGKIIRKEEANLTDLLLKKPFIISRKIWFGYGGIPFFNENIEILKGQILALNLELPEFLLNTHELYRISKRLLNKNKLYKSGSILFQFHVIKKTLNLLGISFASDRSEFPFSDKGHLIRFSNYKKQIQNPLNRFSCYDQTVWKLLELQLNNAQFQNAIISNEKGMVCEGIGSNIFMIKDNTVTTPALDTGCFEDLLRKHIIETASRLNLKVLESSNIKEEDVYDMNEIFFISEERGFEWILGIKSRRFVNEISRSIHASFNDWVKEKVS